MQIGLALLPIALALSGCGIAGLCTNQCPKGWSHGSADCGCMEDAKNPGGGGAGGSVAAACMCSYSDGRYGAWFNLRPPNYGQSSVTVTASTCEYLPVCQLIDESYTVLRGTVSLTHTQWGTNTNQLNNSTVFYAFGYPGHAQNEQPNVPWRYALQFLHFERVAAGPLTNNSIPECETECNVGGSNCLRLGEIPGRTASLRALHSRLITMPKIIEASELVSMFSITDDPCHRRGTLIEGGNISNRGESCTLEAALPSGTMNAYIGVPDLLQGNIKTSGGLIQVDFDRGARASIHFAAPVSAAQADEDTAADFDADWGGDIKAIESNGESVLFSVGAGSCIRTKIK